MRRVEGRQVQVQVELLRHQPCEMDRQVAEEAGFGDGERDGLEMRHRRGDAALQALGGEHGIDRAGLATILLGDAGYHKDPITAQGMTDALLHAECLAQAVLEGMAGVRPLDAALQAYAHRRDVAARPMYELTADLAQLVPPPPEMRALLAALASNPDETRRFLGVMAGTVAVADFFAPDNLARIVGAPPPQEAAAA
jgi:2-polyprenyl-6-methoxyphenol hydroxylase-like FAD-dependent oxidoreductase